ncbi:hypothetical protein HX037_07315 [Ignatzschineria indica]|uniref:hypothetical protein n=1 Tax=Ignatzschineria indica TaxID=472583 RepID=UPI0025754BDF|nr:hypothetical protein [Ignatzschineria indica]MDM1545682.1 hypothetical protein [Ignatzschineria indica]
MNRSTTEAERCRILLSHSYINYAPAVAIIRLSKSFSALKMPTCGHAVVIRAKWFSPAVQQILLWDEPIYNRG